MMKVFLSSMDIEWENIQINAQRIKEVTLHAKKCGCTHIIFPELSLYGFSMNVLSFDQKLVDSVILDLLELSKELNIEMICGSPLLHNGSVFNSLIWFREGKMVIHHKSKLFNYAGEGKFYSESKDGLTLFSGIALSICFELRFPELFSTKRLEFYALINIANWPIAREDHYLTLLKSRAIENQSYVLGVNRSGNDPNVEYGNGIAILYDYSGKKLEADFEGNLHGPFKAYNVDFNGQQEFRKKFKFYE